MLKNSENNYGSVARFFHWTLALLIVGNLIYGAVFSIMTISKQSFGQVILFHKSIGMLILFLMILRWVWHLINIKPKALNETKAMQTMINWYHELLYIAIFIMLASGLLMSASGHHPLPFFYLFSINTDGFTQNKLFKEICSTLHLAFAWTLTVMITLHLLGALRHHFLLKDNTLRRMIKKI